jgi:cell division protein FtsB
MKMLRHFVDGVVRIWHLPFVKYSLIVVVGVLIVCFLGENSLMAHLRNKQYIGELADEIEEYDQHYRHDMRQIRELNRNPKAMERIARERYFMKADDEDIFVLSDDNRELQSVITDDETTE